MSKSVEEIHQIALKFEQGILKLHYYLKNDIIDGIQHGHRLGVLFEEHQEAINQLLIEAKIEELEKIEDCFGNISQVSLSGKRNYNLNLRIKELQSTLKNATEKEQ